MVFRGEHDRRSDQASLVPSPPAGILHQRRSTSRSAARALCLARREYISILQVVHHTKEEVSMLKRQRSGAAQIPARRRPACLPRAELPEAG